MTDRSIIFSAPMVRALLDGRKTMTRRLAWRAPLQPRPTIWQNVGPGDRLWVREGFCPRYFDDGNPAYKADWTTGSADVAMEPKWTTSIHMPRWASRLTLIVTATKIERLQDISEGDAKAEGARWYNGHGVGHSGFRHDPDDGYVWPRATESFGRLWICLHGDDAWWANPEVVALTFTVHKQNIDAMEKAA